MRRPKPFTLRMLAAFLLGGASVLAFAPFALFPLIALTLGGLYALLNQARDNRQKAWVGALIGWSFGFGLFITGVSWLFVSLSVFGEMPAVVAALATVLFCALMAIYPALVGALFVRSSPTSAWQRSLFFAALWTLGEWLRGWLFTGFPWLTIGYSQAVLSPLAGWAPVLGVFGVSLITAFVIALVFEAARGARSTGVMTGLLALALLVAGGVLREREWTTPEGEPISVALLQGNVAQDLKWRPEKFNESLRNYYQLVLENPAQLTVLPETALPSFIDLVPAEYLDEMKRLAERRQGDLLFGTVVGDREQYTNGAVSLGQSPSQRYSKSHLVPFGEFVPTGFHWFLAMAKIPMSEFARGASPQPPLKIAGHKIAVNICYEDAFGEEIIRSLPEATLLVNLSNVAWFGDSLAPAQHLQIAQMRALETGRMMLRATNTGMTAIIGADGRIQSVLPAFTRAALRGEVRAYSGATPYVRWGNAPVIAVAFGALLLAIIRKRNTVS